MTLSRSAIHHGTLDLPLIKTAQIKQNISIVEEKIWQKEKILFEKTPRSLG